MITPGLGGTVLADVRDMQPPFIAALLIAGSATKASQLIRTRLIARGVPGGRPPGLALSGPLAMLMCAVELSLALALLVTVFPVSTHPGTPLFAPRAATGARVAAAAFFLVAGSALIELRGRRPDLGCGCFGDLSFRPPGLRSIARAAALTVAALISVNTPALYLPPRGQGALLFLGLVAGEVALLVALSPEVGEALVRLGYTDPCELRALPAARTLAALHRSRPWRRYHGGITTGSRPMCGASCAGATWPSPTGSTGGIPGPTPTSCSRWRSSGAARGSGPRWCHASPAPPAAASRAWYPALYRNLALALESLIRPERLGTAG